MNRKEWVSNDKAVCSMSQEKHRVQAETVSVLGHTWCVSNDINAIKSIKMPHSETKRSVLQTVASVFYPLGLFAPVSLKGKIFI